MASHKLTDISVRMLKPKATSYQVADGGGLYLKIYPNGSKSWLWRKHSGGKQTNLILGSYPQISLAQARALAQKELQKIQAQSSKDQAAMLTLGEITAEWLAAKDIRPSTRRSVIRRVAYLSNYETLTFQEFTPTTARALIHSMMVKHGPIVASEMAGHIAQIERYAYSIGAIDTPRLQMLSVMIKKPPTEHRRFVTADRLPELCATMREHTTTKTRRIMVDKVKLLMLTLLRCNEAFNLRWDWIDQGQGVITIPASQMKAKREHRVPISTALNRHLACLGLLQNDDGYLLPCKGARNITVPSKRFNQIFEALGILPLISPHGVRSMGRTWFAEQDFNFVHSEYCLAHQVENQVQLSYQRSDYLEQRRPIMEAWGNYVESCFAQYFPD